MRLLSVYQTWSLILLFQIGSNVVFGFAAVAKQDAWIAAGLSGVLGMLLLYLYSKLYEWHPTANWGGLVTHVFGKWREELSPWFTS
ncbi:spore germination protein [Brevibacillus humidisoli]|nr:GerAB/ArcD/ProY family transporter [Brevibacillus humidisoli]UFJ39145.1 spore germination protein [Brevibacillus humidisoli]